MGGLCLGVTITETPLTETNLRQRPSLSLDKDPYWTEIPQAQTTLDRDCPPPGQRPLWTQTPWPETDPPGHRPLIWTQTPAPGQTTLDTDPPDRDPPGQRPPSRQRLPQDRDPTGHVACGASWDRDTSPSMWTEF